MKQLYRFNLDCGRMGELEGLFITTPEVLNKALNKTIYLYEVLGKHSEIEVTITNDTLTLLSEDQDKLEWLLNINGGFETISGINPLEYVEEEEEEEDEE